MRGVQLAQATPVVRGTGQEAGPSSAVATLAKPPAAEGFTGGATSYGFGPGTTTAPAAPAPQATTQPATPPPVTMPAPPPGGIAVPNTLEEFRKLHPELLTPNADDVRSFSTDPDQSQLANIQAQRRNAEERIAAARAQIASAPDMATVDKGQAAQDAAKHDLDAAITAENKLRQDASNQGSNARAKWYTEHNKTVEELFSKARDANQALTLEQQRGDQARQTEAAKSENAYVLEDRKRFSTDRDTIRGNMDGLGMLRALSAASGTSTPLENIVVGDKSGRDWMVNLGLGTQAARDKWGAQQAFEALKNQIILQLRQGVSMGQLSDRDLSFLQGMGPSLLQRPETRAQIISLLEQAQIRKLQYMDKVEELHDQGMSWGKAKRTAQDNQPPLIGSLPDGYSGWDAAQQKQWKRTNWRPHQFVYSPDGQNLSTYEPKD